MTNTNDDGLQHLKDATPGKLFQIQRELQEQGLLDTEYGKKLNEEVWDRLKKMEPKPKPED